MALGLRLNMQMRRTGFMLTALIFGPAATAVHSAEPAGTITIARDVPARSAFRPGALGTPTNVATAREDVIVASTHTVGTLPNALTDAALGTIASAKGIGTGPLSGSGGLASALSLMPGATGAGMSRPTAAAVNSLAQALPSGSAFGAVTALGAALNTMPGSK